MNRIPTTVVLCTVMIVSEARLHASEHPTSLDDSTSLGRTVSFSVGLEPHYSSASSNGGYTVAMGVGYQATPRVNISFRFYTGDENMAQQGAIPVWGRFRIGGASLESTLLLAGGTMLVPFVSLGFGLYTIETRSGLGYNGNGPHVAGGIELDFSRNVSLSVAGLYRPLRFYNTVGDTDPAGIFEPFHDYVLGIGAFLTFYPNILP